MLMSAPQINDGGLSIAIHVTEEFYTFHTGRVLVQDALVVFGYQIENIRDNTIDCIYINL